MHHTLARSCLIGVLAATGCGSPSPVRLERGGYALELDPGALTLTLSRGADRLLRLPADGLLLGTVTAREDQRSYDPYWLDADSEILPQAPPEGLAFHAPRAAELQAPSAAEDPSLAARLDYGDGLHAILSLRLGGEGRFAIDLSPEPGAGPPVVFARLRLRSDATEGFYGLGMSADEVNQRGHLRPMQLEVDPTESSNNEARVPVPLLIGTRGWGLFIESQRLGVFDVARAEADLTQVTYAVDPTGLRFHLLAAGHPLDIPRRYFDLTGDPLLPAPWALGPWLWRNESRDQAQVLADLRELRARDLPTSAIWLDRPFATAVNSFDFDARRYPDPAGLIAAARAAGFRLALWSTPYLDQATGPLLAQAQAAGYFPPQTGILLNSWGKPIDFSNPAAYRFWQDLISRYTDAGIEGFKLDYGEDVVASLGGARNVWRFADGSDERTMQHRYAALYHRAYAERLPKEGAFLLGRTGRWGDQQNVSVIWPGDMDATFTAFRERFVPRGGAKEVVGVGGLPATVVQGLTLATSGFPFFGADTGGYRHSPPDRELYIRWFQQTALSAVMQIGDASSQPVWEFTAENGRDEATVALYRAYTRLHLRLFPYEWTYAQRMRRDGRPIVRPFGFAAPELGAHPSDQYFFGDDLLVAPVLQRGQTRRSVVLPPGYWLDYWDGALLAGGAAVEVAAPLDRLPLYLRAGAIVPLLRPAIDTLSPSTDPAVESYANDPGVLYARVAPGPAATSFTLYDGTVIAQEVAGSLLRFTGGERFRSGAMLELLRSAAPQAVRLDGGALAQVASLEALERAGSGWYWSGSGAGTLWVRVPAAAAEQQVRVVR